MIITCKKCRTRFQLNEAGIKHSRFKVRCSECRAVFMVRKPETDDAPYQLKQEEKLVENKPAQAAGYRIISISNQKGGVAKTSTCLNLGISLSLMKKRVLLIDLDVQSNLTLSLGYEDSKSFFDYLESDETGRHQFIKKTKYSNLWLLPANQKMLLLTRKYFGIKNFEFMLKNSLNGIRNEFDYILIDTPPSIEFFTLNALTSADFVIIPSQCEFLSTRGVDQIERVIESIKKKSNQHLDYKILITMYDSELTSSNVIFSKLIDKYQDKAFRTTIALDPQIRESQIMSMPVIYYNKNSKSGRQYINLAKEFLHHQGIRLEKKA